MHRNSSFLIVLLSILLAGSIDVKSQAQPTRYAPSQILPFPTIQPDSLRFYDSIYVYFDSIFQNDIPFDSLSEEDKRISFQYEMELSEGPFYTGPYGCSWYCATTPTDFQTSSTLPASSVSDYKPENIHDFDLRTAWVEGQEGYGLDEKIDISIPVPDPLALTEIILFNGYCKSYQAWLNNSRVKELNLFIDGELQGVLQLDDTYLGQRFEIGSFTQTDKPLLLTLEIVSIYPGRLYSDVAISEVNFNGTGDH